MKKKSIILIFILWFINTGLSQMNSHEISVNGIKRFISYNPQSEYLVVLVHGYGLTDLDGTLEFGTDPTCIFEKYKNQEIKIYKELSDNLFEMGFSTFRYEKLNSRTSKSDRRSDDITPDAYVKDLYNVLTWINNNDSFRQRKIILFGWSEGVTVALNILKLDIKIHGVIGYGGVFKDIIKMEAEKLYKSIVICENDINKAHSFKQQYLEKTDSVSQNVNDPTFQNRIILVENIIDPKDSSVVGKNTFDFGISKKYYWNMSNLINSSLDILTDTKTPVLIIHGVKDFKVPIEQHYFLKSKFQDNLNINFEMLIDSDHFIRNDYIFKMNNDIFTMINKWRTKIATEPNSR